MTVEPIRKADPELIKALSRAAATLGEDQAFLTATRALHSQWYGQLMNEGLTDTPKVLDLVAKLRALEAIPKMLDHFVTSEIMAQRGQDGRRR